MNSKLFLKYSRKTFSFFMAVLMVFSMLVFVPEMFTTEAEAASAGTYYVKISWTNTSKYTMSSNYTGHDNKGNTQAGISLYYKTNNGTDEEKEVYWNIGKGAGSGYVGGAYVSVGGTGYLGSTSGSSNTCWAVISGFPTEVHAYLNAGNLFENKKYQIDKIEVGASSTSTLTTLWTGTCQVNSRTGEYCNKIDSSSSGSNVKNTCTGSNSDDYVTTTTNNWVYPYASTMTISSFGTSPVTAPSASSASVATSTFTYGATDQYGVVMASSLCTVSCTSNQASNQVNGSNAITITASGGSGTVNVPFAANIKGTTNSQTVTVKCSWSGGSTKTKSATLTVNDATYTATFNYKTAGLNTSGTTASKSATAQYGCSPTAPITPGIYYTTTDHYTFSSWKNNGTTYTTSLPAMTSDMTFDAAYTVEAHSFNQYSAVSATQTHTKTCSCGYSVTESCSWDNGVQTVAPTCVTKGSTLYTCVNCGNTKTEQNISTITHSYTGAIKNNGNGTHSYKCVNGCDEYGATVNCTYKSEVTKQPTCTEAGVTTYTCQTCGYSYTENIPAASGHDYKFSGFTWDSYTSATAKFTCSKDGSHTQTVTAEIKSNVDKAANCVDTGLKTYTATVVFNSITYTDTKTETLSINNKNHKTLVSDGAVSATTDTVGLTQGQHCSACGTVITAQEITPTVPKSKVYEGAVTDNIKGSYTYLGVTTTKPTAMTSTTKPTCETYAVGSYGTIRIENGEAVFNVTTMQFSGTETFYLLASAENIDSNSGTISAYIYEKVTIVPTKTLYYEDNFTSSDNSGITYTNGVCSDGSSKYGVWNINNASSVNDAADEAAALVYNSDYKSYATLSGGAAHTVSVSELNKGNSNKNWPSAAFTFAGTGFDVISLTDSNSGVFYVTVYSGTDTTAKPVKTVMMDTYYGYTYSPLYFNTATKKIVGEAENEVTTPLYPSKIIDKNSLPENDSEYIVTSNGEVYTTNTQKASSSAQAYGWVKSGNAQTLYQVPVIHIDGLTYGTYTAKIEARFTGLFGHFNTDSDGVNYYDLCIDAIRINNPFDTDNSDEAYDQSGQSRVNYTDIKSSLATENEANSSNATGLLLLDGGKTVSQSGLEEFKNISPKNEIYLAGGQSVAFDIDTEGFEDISIGMRTANATPLTVKVIYGSKSADIEINSGTELYYSLISALGSDTLSGTVVIKNNTIGSVLSMTNMKTVAKEVTVAAATPMMLSKATATRARALLTMSESDLSIDEESVETSSENGVITLSVTTGSDVSELIIRDENGNELTPDKVNSIVSGDEIKWTVTLTETESGSYTYSLEGAYENGYTNGDTVKITVDVDITEPIPEELKTETPQETPEDDGENDAAVTFFDFIVTLLKKLLSKIFGF